MYDNSEYTTEDWFKIFRVILDFGLESYSKLINVSYGIKNTPA